MNEVIDPSSWREFLKTFSQHNEGKPTRIGIFESTNGLSNDYWLEDGLPLIGLDSYSDKGKTRIDILLDKYTHSIEDAARLVKVNAPESDQGLDISDSYGRTTVLRLESWDPQSEDH